MGYDIKSGIARSCYIVVQFTVVLVVLGSFRWQKTGLTAEYSATYMYLDVIE